MLSNNIITFTLHHQEKNESDSVELSTIHETSQLNERDPVTPQGIQVSW